MKLCASSLEAMGFIILVSSYWLNELYVKTGFHTYRCVHLNGKIYSKHVFALCFVF